MPVLPIAELKAALLPGRRLMGLDVGEKTVGLALSDRGLMVASPLETIRRTKFTKDWERLLSLSEAHEVGGLVIGLPVNMDGTQGPKCQSVRHFGKNILDRRQMPLAFWDERWSTQAVQRMMTEEADLSRARRAELVDKMAAAYILQGALDRLGYAASR
jgi:putative Holliday junction resolvase